MKTTLRLAWEWIKANQVEFILSLSAIFFFWMFTRGTAIRSTSNGPIATVESGRAIRRSGSFLEGSTALRGTKLYHLDFLWIPEGEKAEVRFEDGKTIRLSEKTLMVVKLAFNPELGNENAAQLIRGSYFASDSQEQRSAPDFWSRLAEVPQQSATGQNSDASSKNPESPGDPEKPRSTLGSLPSQNLILYRDGQSNKPMGFTFPSELTGTLIIRNLNQDSTEMVPLQRVRSVAHPLANGSRYRWQVISAEKETILGPFEFELRSFTPEAMKQIQALPQDEQKRVQVEILGDK